MSRRGNEHDSEFVVEIAPISPRIRVDLRELLTGLPREQYSEFDAFEGSFSAVWRVDLRFVLVGGR